MDIMNAANIRHALFAGLSKLDNAEIAATLSLQALKGRCNADLWH